MSDEKVILRRKPLEEMDVIDDFLFTEIMSDERYGTEVCRMILGRVLKREVGVIKFTPQRVVPGVSEQSHGIRMDAYITEQKDGSDGKYADINVYDIEPDKKCSNKDSLPRRSRYYGDLIDVKLLERNVDYDKLPDLVTIFILSYDPFGAGLMYYEAASRIITHPDIPYNDGIRRIYLYVGGKLPENAGEEERKLRDLLKYIGKSSDENITDETIKRLDEIVRKTKADKNVGKRFMKSWEWESEIRKEALEEARAFTEAERERADKAEAKASEAEAKASEAEAKASEAEAKASEAEAKASEAEAKANVAEAAASRAEEDARAAREELARYKAKYGEIA